jgi:hypothetical protein
LRRCQQEPATCAATAPLILVPQVIPFRESGQIADSPNAHLSDRGDVAAFLFVQAFRAQRAQKLLPFTRSDSLNPVASEDPRSRVSSLMNISGQSGEPRSPRSGRSASTGNFPCADRAFLAEQITC